MTTPAKQAGITESVTVLSYIGPIERHKAYDWLLSMDDGSTCPYFKSVCGEYSLCEWLTNFKVKGAELSTPALAKGIKVGQTVRLTRDYGTSWKAGDSITLTVDDNTTEPRFEHNTHRRARYIPLKHVELIVDVPPVPAVPLAPQPIEASAMTYTNLQKQAVDTFTMMLEAVKLYRADKSANPRPNGLVYNYGICDNIERFAELAGARYGQMSHVKENLIRTVDCYSGEYHYPVKGAQGYNASDSFSNITDKWSGEYGDNRTLQLEQLVEAIKTRWTDELAGRLTPVQRMGYVIGDIFQNTRDQKFYVLRRDDDSNDPGFGPVGSPESEYSWMQLDQMVKVSGIQDKMEVSEFIAKLKELELQKAEIQRIIEEQQKALAACTSQIAMYDFSLGQQHGVKRI